MFKENLVFANKPIEVSEYENYKIATFLISVLDEYNANGVLIEKAEGEKYHKTIIGYPILAYLEYDKNGKPTDFGGHELRAKLDDNDNIVYYFATTGIGSVIDSWIETREVEGYEGEKDVILIKAKLWTSRYPEYFKVLDELWEENNVATSWEISVEESEKTSKGKKLKVFEFIGNTILGRNVQGAVKSAGMLEIAENDIDANSMLATAFAKDVKYNSKKEESNMSKKNENAALTMCDLWRKIERAVEKKMDKWMVIPYIFTEERKIWAYDWDRESELDYYEFTYTVEDDEVSVSEPKEVKLTVEAASEKNNIVVKLDETAKLLSKKETQISELEKEKGNLSSELSEKTEALVKANEKIDTLNDEVSKLKPFKEKIDAIEKAEKEKQTAEEKENLKQYALKSKRITEEELETSEEIKKMIDELDKESINNLIAERLMKELSENERDTTEGTETASANITDNEDEPIEGNIISKWLSQRK